MTSKTMTAVRRMWRCLFEHFFVAHCHWNRLLQPCSHWHFGGTSVGSFFACKSSSVGSIVLLLSKVTQVVHPIGIATELFHLVLPPAIFDTTPPAKKITYDILPWVTQSSWQMSWRFICLPEVMENHSRRNPVGGVQRIEGHFFIQISPHGAELDRAEKVPRSKWKLKLRQLYSMQPYYTPASNVTFYSMLLLQNSFICFLVVENQSDSTMYLRI